MAGPKIATDTVLKLIERRANFAGVVDSSNDWQWQINVLSNAQRVRSDFQLLCGTDYMISAGANGATGMFSPLAGVAPELVSGSTRPAAKRNISRHAKCRTRWRSCIRSSRAVDLRD